MLPQAHKVENEKTPLLSRSSGIGRLGLGAVLAIVFFNVSGGPIGSEGIIRDAGPMIGLACLLVMVFVYSIPQALMTAELSTTFPRNGGYSIWVQEAFGNFWGLQESYYSWVSGVVDNAIYPILLFSSARSILGGEGLAPIGLNSCQAGDIIEHQAGGNPANLFRCMFSAEGNCAIEYLLKVAIAVVFTIPTLLTNRSFGFNMIILMVLVLMPFVVMCLIGIPEMHLSNLVQVPQSIAWHGLFNLSFWNVTGFDCCSTFANEVDDPKEQVIPRTLVVAVVVMTLGYVLPLGIGAAVDKDWHCWTSGSLPHVAQIIGGNWLGLWVLMSSLLSNWAMYGAELFEDSYQLLGMSEAGLIPKFFAGRSSMTGTPVNAILFQVVIIFVMLGLDFSQVLVIDNFFTVASNLIEFSALLKLRIYQPDLVRPYKIPLGNAALTACFAPAFMIAATLLYTNATQSGDAARVCIGATLLGFPLCGYGAYRASDASLEDSDSATA